ncbi:hypothetical protein P7K49_020540 [Saguinus oedipus]|uniref:Uncharacterized protein n=1 Tax=Saguinus oedipus TaxID=9490 RepID=A0ABQ9V0G7_SAGOE|nr:hypothetical protein P7K49_020540 [Saguinus oedipus]
MGTDCQAVLEIEEGFLCVVYVNPCLSEFENQLDKEGSGYLTSTVTKCDVSLICVDDADFYTGCSAPPAQGRAEASPKAVRTQAVTELRKVEPLVSGAPPMTMERRQQWARDHLARLQGICFLVFSKWFWNDSEGEEEAALRGSYRIACPTALNPFEPPPPPACRAQPLSGSPAALRACVCLAISYPHPPGLVLEDGSGWGLREEKIRSHSHKSSPVTDPLEECQEDVVLREAGIDVAEVLLLRQRRPSPTA